MSIVVAADWTDCFSRLAKGPVKSATVESGFDRLWMSKEITSGRVTRTMHYGTEKSAAAF